MHTTLKIYKMRIISHIINFSNNKTNILSLELSGIKRATNKISGAELFTLPTFETA